MDKLRRSDEEESMNLSKYFMAVKLSKNDVLL